MARIGQAFTPGGAGTVTSVSGTANRITSTGGTTPVIDISGSYVGQTSITTLGTITTGVWSATDIGLADGGTGASLTDPNADRIYFWDDSAGSTDWLAPGNSIAITTTTIDTIQDIRTTATPSFSSLSLTVAGTGLSVTQDAVMGGYLRVGSTSAPTNTTAGDVTLTRLIISDNSAFGTNGRIIRSLGSMTDTAAGAAYYAFFQPTINHTANSSSDFRLLGFDGIWNPGTSSGFTAATLNGGVFQFRIRGDGTVSTVNGITTAGTVVDSSSASSVTVTTINGINIALVSRPSGTSTLTTTTATALNISMGSTANMVTATTYKGVAVGNPGANAITTLVGIDIASLTRGNTTSIAGRFAFPGIGTGQTVEIVNTTDAVALQIPTASVGMGNTTGTTTNAHGVSIGIATYTSTTNTRTITNAAGLYIAGAPVASTNVTVTNGPYSIWVDAGTSRFDGELTLNNKVTTYDAVATAGWGVPAIYASARSTGQTAAVGSVATYTVGAADGSFLVSSNVLVTTSSAENFTVTCAYTDEGNTSRTITLNFQLVGGVIGTAINFANGAVPYEGIPIRIRAKASTSITIATTGTFTGATYNVEGGIMQIA